MVDVFFYGLFMDIELLSRKGLSPSNPRIAALSGYALSIGKRATLIPAVGSKVYGLVIGMESDELNQLYSEASVADYCAEPVVVSLADGTTLDVLCYNLPEAKRSSASNHEYATSLRQLAGRLGLPSEYVAQIQ